MKNKYIQMSVAVVLAVLLMVIADLVPFWMPDMMEMLALLIVVVLLTIWAGFVVYEHAEDEREISHKMFAGQVSYLSGIGILTFALLIQGFTHTIDPWVPMALLVMVLSKLGARLYSERHR